VLLTGPLPAQCQPYKIRHGRSGHKRPCIHIIQPEKLLEKMDGLPFDLRRDRVVAATGILIVCAHEPVTRDRSRRCATRDKTEIARTGTVGDLVSVIVLEQLQRGLCTDSLTWHVG